MTVFTTDDVYLVRCAVIVDSFDETGGCFNEVGATRLRDLADRIEREAVDPDRPYFDRLGILRDPETPAVATPATWQPLP